MLHSAICLATLSQTRESEEGHNPLTTKIQPPLPAALVIPPSPPAEHQAQNRTPLTVFTNSNLRDSTPTTISANPKPLKSRHSTASHGSPVFPRNIDPETVLPEEGENDLGLLTLRACGHMFHAGCLEKWIERRRYDCPVCRRDFLEGKDATERRETLRLLRS